MMPNKKVLGCPTYNCFYDDRPQYRAVAYDPNSSKFKWHVKT
uniref:Uncharacterized protein n=1 Tax=Rhizophora mucronata TaxID=61149 RepID=A0A2P2N0W4_RHIMU